MSTSAEEVTLDYYADDDIDWISVHQVAKDRMRLKLKPKERIEAVKIMSARGIPAFHQAWLLMVKPDSLRVFCSNNKIKLPRERDTAHWTLGYVDKRK